MEEKKFILNIGLNDKDRKKQTIRTKKAERIIIDCILQYCTGYTLTRNEGGYTHTNGKKVKEKSITATLQYTTLDAVLKIINTLKIKLNQESIGLEEVLTNYKYL